MDIPQDCDLATFFEDCSQSEQLSENKLPLTVRQHIAPVHNLSQFSTCRSMGFQNLPQFSNFQKLWQFLRMIWASYDYSKKLRQVLKMIWASSDYFKKLRQVLKMVWASSDNFKKLRQVLKVVWASSDYFKKLRQVLKMVWASWHIAKTFISFLASCLF